jgi:hypothetical protein
LRTSQCQPGALRKTVEKLLVAISGNWLEATISNTVGGEASHPNTFIRPANQGEPAIALAASRPDFFNRSHPFLTLGC